MDYLKYAKDYGFGESNYNNRFGMTRIRKYINYAKIIILNQYTKWLILVPQSLNLQRHTTMEHMKPENESIVTDKEKS